MARLPDATALNTERPQPSGTVAGYDGGMVGRAVSGLGADLKDVGEKQSQFEYQRARSHLLTSGIQAESDLENDQDFQTYEKRYTAAMSQARDESLNLISDPRMRENFQYQADEDFDRGLAGVQAKVREKQKDFGAATLGQQLDSNFAAAMNSPDEATTAALLRSSSGLIDGAVARGYIGAEAGYQEKRKRVADYAANKIALMPAADQVKMLGYGQKQGQDAAGAIPADLTAAPGTGASTTSADQPRGIRNNNPGNLTGDDPWQGKTGADDKGFAQFDTPESGLRAMAVNLRNQQKVHGLDSVEEIISKYAPPSENDTPGYIRTVARALDVDPTEVLDLDKPGVLSTMMQSMIGRENGKQPYSKDSIDWAAKTASDPTVQGAMPAATAGETGTPVKSGTLADFIPPHVRTEMLLRAQTVLAKQGDVLNAQAQYNNPDYLYDPGSKTDRKGVDILFNQAGGVQALSQMSDAGAVGLTAVAQRTGIIPPKAQGALRALMDTGSSAQKAYAYDVISRLQEAAPKTLDQFKPEELSRATMYNNYLRNGLDQKTALQYVQTKFDPLNTALMESRKTQASQFLKDTLGKKDANLPSVFEDIFDPGIFTRGPDLPRNAAAAGQALSTYRDALETEYMMHGDPDVAKQRAADQVKRIYGQTEVTGKPTIMMYPPENHYAIPGVDNGWMQKQLADDLHAMPGQQDTDVKDVELMSDRTTAADISAGRLPRYQVLKQQNGVWDALRDDKGAVLYYNFDPQKIVNDLTEKQNAERQTLLNNAQVIRAVDQQYGDTGGLPALIGKKALTLYGEYAVNKAKEKK